MTDKRTASTDQMIKKILLIRMRRLGDVVLSTALLSELRQSCPTAIIDFLVFEHFAPLLDHHPAPTNVIPYKKQNSIKLLTLLRNKNYDLVIDLQSNFRTMIITAFSGAKDRLGWKKSGPPRAFTKSLSRNQLPKLYVPLEHKRFLQLANLPIYESSPTLYFSQDEFDRSEKRLWSKGLDPTKPRIGLHLSATDSTKIWPIDNFIWLSHKLLEKGYIPIVFSPANDNSADPLFQEIPQVIDARSNDLRLFIAGLSSCKAFFSSDTGPAHVATALNVPRVTLFSNSDPTYWTPRSSSVIPLQSETIPPKASDITPEQALKALEQVLS